MRGKFIAVALGALAQRGEQRDAAFGRKYLTADETGVRLASIALLERFGDESDCGRLLEAARGEWSTREAAARAAVKLAKGSPSMIRSLLGSGDLSVVRVAIESPLAACPRHTAAGGARLTAPSADLQAARRPDRPFDVAAMDRG